ncbi:MAG: sensor histidine kinase [Proteobacteria bacterium]|nr:sensor histidine kinase [Pseudomonadota bacterium]
MDTYRDTVSENKPRDGALAPSEALFSPKPLPLQIRLLVLIAGTLVPMLVLSGVVVFQSYERAKDAAAEQVLQLTRSTMIAVDRELRNQIAALEVLALSPSLRAEDLSNFGADAERFLTRFPEGTGISVADPNGVQLFNTFESASPTLARPEVLEAVAAVFAGQGPQVSNVYLSRRAGEVTFTVVVPVMHEGKVLYALAFNPPRASFTDILRRPDLREGWVLSVFDRVAHHVARRPVLSDRAITSASDSLRAQLEAGGERLTETTSVEGTRVLTAFTLSVETGWVVAVGVPIGQYQAPTLRSFATTFSIGAVLILFGGYFAVRIARQLVGAERHRELLINELNHRVKNTLASVQAIVWRGLRNSGAAPEVHQAIEARLQALSSVHNVLSSKHWEGAYLEEVVRSIIAPYTGQRAARAIIDGPSVALRPHVAIALAMILNELATNAVKYGALSAPNGVVSLVWLRLGAERLRLTWEETGGPAVQPPAQTGYGTRFIERAVVDELRGDYMPSFPPEGFRCVIEIAL